MKAMLLHRIADLKKEKEPLREADVPEPVPADREIVIRISVCGVCHTELDEIEGRTPPPRLPIIPGHQVVGRVVSRGSAVTRYSEGERVGVAWIYKACGKCEFCNNGEENLCPEFKATGRDEHGGYAEYMKILEDFAYAIPRHLTDDEAAPLFCAGAIGYRSLNLTQIENGQSLGLTGFGASGHLVLRLAQYLFPDTRIYVFARSATERDFAMKIGAEWAGDIGERSPQLIHAIIDTTPVWKPVRTSLESLKPGGRLVINAIRKEEHDKKELLQLDYPEHLWMEKEIKSVANITSNDVSRFLKLAAKAGIKPDVQQYDLSEANKALIELKEGNIQGAKVLRIK